MKVQLDYPTDAVSCGIAESIARELNDRDIEVTLPHRDMPHEVRFNFEALRKSAESQDFVLVLWTETNIRITQQNPQYASAAVRRLRDVGIHKIIVLNLTNSALPGILEDLRSTNEVGHLAELMRTSSHARRQRTGHIRASKHFLSYSAKDLACAQRIYTALSSRGPTWYAPESMLGNVSFMEEIYEAIERSERFFIILTQHSVGSGYCIRELYTATDTGRPITALSEIPLDAVPKGIRFALAGHHVRSMNCAMLSAAQIERIIA